MIIPDEIDVRFLREFKRVIMKNSRKYKFVIVCGGGGIARKYIKALGKIGASVKFQDLAGVGATRMNARFMSCVFKVDVDIPSSFVDVENILARKDVVFCGSIKFDVAQTSDTDAVKVADKFNGDFINLTNVMGLYNKNPAKYRDAKFIPEISFEDFYKVAVKKKFKPGQHFVLDQTSAKIIRDKKIVTYIVGKNMRNLDDLLNGRKFKGTVVGKGNN